MKQQRLRIHFSKTDQMRFTGHLDLILTWERIFRRSGLPLAYSEGFSPRPLLSMAAPLPLGFTSIGEIGDFWLSEIVQLNTVQSNVKNALPPGLEIHSVHEIPDLFKGKLPSLIIAAKYSSKLIGDVRNLDKRIKELLDSPALIWERKGKSFDIRPLITDLVLAKQTQKSSAELFMTLSNLPGATGRPDDVIAVLNVADKVEQICRTEIILKDEVL